MDSSTIKDLQVLYVAILGRAADKAGLNYWLDQIEKGQITLDGVRASFVEQLEYQELYAYLSNTELVEKVYQQLFGRAPEPLGLEYWVEQLDRGNPITADKFVKAVVDGAVDKAGEDALVIANKVNVSEQVTTLSRNKKTDASFLELASEVINGVDHRAQTVADALQKYQQGSANLTDKYLFWMDFEDAALGTFSQQDLEAAVGDNSNSVNLFGEAEVISVNGNKKLLVTLKEGEVKNGIQFYKTFEGMDELYFSTSQQYVKGFDWTAGSKGPGVGSIVEGFGNPTGLKFVGPDEGYSYRHMVREDGLASQYIYNQESKARYAQLGEKAKPYEEVAFKVDDAPFQFIQGETYLYTQYIKNNTPGIADGEVLSQIQGRTVFHDTQVMLSQSGDNKPNALFYDAWHGGTTDEFKPSVDSQIIIDDVIISTEFINPYDLL